MKSRLILVAATCVAFTTPFLGQSTDAPSKLGEKDKRVIDLLSDTKGFDLKPYLYLLVGRVRTNWFERIPESAQRKTGRVAVRFRVMRDGHVTDVKYDAKSGDETLDRAAYSAILASNPLQPLPGEFACEFVELRFKFYYNPDPATVPESNDQVLPCVTSKVKFVGGLAVTVSPTSAQVAVGSQQQFHATIAGEENSTVTWSVGCEGSTCGTISADGLYTAPTKIPNPATITVTVTLKTTPTESASSTVTIVRAGDSQ
jgi:TonB family protein